MTLFGEYLDERVLADARRIAAAAQPVLPVGSSPTVEPAASPCAAGPGR